MFESIAKRAHRTHRQSLSLSLGTVEQGLGRLLTVPLRVVLSPPPQVFACLFQCLLGLPFQLLVGLGRVGREVQNVTSTAGDDLIWQITADSMTESLDHVINGRTLSGAQIPGADPRMVFSQVIQCDQVTSCKIVDVDVVADGGAIF